MKLTDVIRRPLITEKTSILREDGRTIVFHVATGANKIEIKRAIEQLLGIEGRQHPDGHRPRQSEAAGPLRRPPVRLEEGIREAARRREDARVSGRRVTSLKAQGASLTGMRLQT